MRDDNRSQRAFWNVGEAWACIASVTGQGRSNFARSSRKTRISCGRHAGLGPGRTGAHASASMSAAMSARACTHVGCSGCSSHPVSYGCARMRRQAATPVMSPRGKPRDFAEGLWLSVSNFGTLLKVFAAPLSSLLLSARRTAGRRSGRYAPTSGKDENLQQSAEV